MTVISFPIPPYANVPIEPQFYQPSRFVISAISLGPTTTITTSVNHNYVIGQLVRLLIPQAYGSFQLNEVKAYVISIPTTTQVVLDFDSRNTNPFITTPYTATITNATQANPCVLTANNFFSVGGFLTITGVTGMTELNGKNRQIQNISPTTITLNLDSTGFTAYISGGIATLQVPQTAQPQILAIGDINSGAINASGRTANGTFPPGSFINISPQ